jgi:hypothetical protein
MNFIERKNNWAVCHPPERLAVIATVSISHVLTALTGQRISVSKAPRLAEKQLRGPHYSAIVIFRDKGICWTPFTFLPTTGREVIFALMID